VGSQVKPKDAPAVDPLLAAIEEQTRWLRAIAMPQVRESVMRTLTKPKMRAAYEASDGKNAARDVARTAGVSLGSASGWWRRWRAVGIGIELPSGRVAHIVTLRDLGLTLDPEED
jgi:hypothetical protein